MKKLAIKFINFYQDKISKNTIPRCRYTPTCSQYAKEAFENFNFFKAFAKSFYRIIRCNPWSKGGYDPVIKEKNKIKRGCKEIIS